MADITLTGQSPRWSNIPDDGIDVATEAARAARQGAPAITHLITGLSGPDGAWPEICFGITAAGEAQMVTPGWEPVVRDGKVVALRDLEAVSG